MWPGSDEGDPAARAVERARGLLRDALASTTRAERRRQHRLGRIVDDLAARELVQRLTDEVLRFADDARAARRFSRLVRSHGLPRAFGPVDRLLLVLGAAVAPRLPRVVMPMVRARIVRETRGLVLSASDVALARHIRRRRAEGFSLNLSMLGEAILSDDEAEQRLERVVACIARPDVDNVSVKITALVAELDVLAFDHSVDCAAVALRRVYDAAATRERPVLVTLDMEEYSDLHLTVAAFRRVLSEERYRTLPAGIAIQAYLPDSHDVVEDLGSWAATRVEAGGPPIKIRLVKGANLAMERVDAELHGWEQAPYATKAEVDASFLRLLDSLLRPEWSHAVRIGAGSHNLFDIAWALELPASARRQVELEMLEGMVPAQARVVRDAAGGLLLYCPVVRRDETPASLAYLARRFDENTAPDNFLRAMFALTPESAEFDRQAQRFLDSVRERETVSTRSRRRAERPAPSDTFANEPDGDFTDLAVRDSIVHALASPPAPTVRVIDEIAEIDALVERARTASDGWARLATAERARILDRVADVMASERPGTIALMAHEAAKTPREADPEVSEAIDFARHSARHPPHEGSAPVGVVVVTSPWNFPYAIPAGGVFAALMAGNAVILKPAPETRATARHLVDQCHRAGVPADVLQYVACPDDDVGRRLVTSDLVDTVILTGAHATAMMFLDWKPSMRLLAETSGKNAIVVTAAADEDAAVGDLVHSAFAHAGQKCSAASLAIVEASLHDGTDFLRRLAAAVRTLRVGPATDLATTMGPLIAPPGDALRRALTTLDPDESWLVEPACLDADGRLWSPGVKLGVQRGSWFQRTECFGPVLGIIRADDLEDAIEIQNDSEYGLTGGLQSLDDDEIETWLARVQVGNAYVNRAITGAVVGRQPFGGWKHSSVGGGPKPGGPAYVGAFARPDAVAIDPVAARAAYLEGWDEGAGCDVSDLSSETNLLRHLPLRSVVVRAGEETPAGALEAAMAAAEVTGVEMSVSIGDENALARELATHPPERLRLLSPASDDVLRTSHELHIDVDASPISPLAEELIHWVEEQSLSVTRHRHGRVPSNVP